MERERRSRKRNCELDGEGKRDGVRAEVNLKNRSWRGQEEELRLPVS